MKLLHVSALLLCISTIVRSETTVAPNLVVDEQTHSSPGKLPETIDRAENVIETPVKNPAEEVNPNSPVNPGQLLGPNLVNMQPINRPMNAVQQPPPPPPPPMQFQVRVPPFFGNPFKPSVIRSQSPNFVALPPKDQPTFDSLHCHQGPNSKRDLERRPLPFGEFYLNNKNQDVLFSVCGTVVPAHLILIEPVSGKFEQLISAHQKNGTNPIVINDFSNLFDQVPSQSGNASSTNSSVPLTSGCENFETAFKLFLKYFYVGEQAFDEIQELDVAILVWRLGVAFLDVSAVQQQIEPRIGSLISLDTLGKVYRFANAHQIASLNRKWAEFITSNSRVLADSDRLPLSCADIGGDTEYLDRFIEALNVNQSTVIGYIRQYLRTCPESANFAVPDGSNPFPRSLLYYRCTIDDLKELIKIGFLNYETLAEELENRLRVNERHFDEKCAAKFAPVANFRHVIPLNPGASHSVSRRA